MSYLKSKGALKRRLLLRGPCHNRRLLLRLGRGLTSEAWLPSSTLRVVNIQEREQDLVLNINLAREYMVWSEELPDPSEETAEERTLRELRAKTAAAARVSTNRRRGGRYIPIVRTNRRRGGRNENSEPKLPPLLG
eukprot:4640590-Pyramimonas_sp.AAC.1